MAQASVRPCTEEEIFEPKKNSVQPKGKVIPINPVSAVTPYAMPLCSTGLPNEGPSWVKRNQTALIIGSLILAGVVVWYCWREHEKEKQQKKGEIK